MPTCWHSSAIITCIYTPLQHSSDPPNSAHSPLKYLGKSAAHLTHQTGLRTLYFLRELLPSLTASTFSSTRSDHPSGHVESMLLLLLSIVCWQSSVRQCSRVVQEA